jgi:hypothetical protein
MERMGNGEPWFGTYTGTGTGTEPELSNPISVR